MNINWLLRLKNKTTLLSLIVASVTFVYTVLGLFNIVPPVTQDTVMQIATALVNLLLMLGIVVDPTTEGVSDSKQAMEYTEPKKD